MFPNYRIILASASPRRQELVAQIGLTVEVVPSSFQETLPKSSYSNPADYTVATAQGKAVAVSRSHPDSVVIGADTIVVVDGRIMEKPADSAGAVEMLGELSGRVHHVYTGVCVWYKGQVHTFYDDTEVCFTDLSKELISWYVGTGEPLDKAGGYGIQGKGALLVHRINGCYFNVVGLPLQKLYTKLKEILH